MAVEGASEGASERDWAVGSVSVVIVTAVLVLVPLYRFMTVGRKSERAGRFDSLA